MIVNDLLLSFLTSIQLSFVVVQETGALILNVMQIFL